MKEVFIKLFTIVSLDLTDVLLGLYLDLLVLLDVLTDRHVVTEVHLEAGLSTLEAEDWSEELPAPAILRHKEPARASKAGSLWYKGAYI